MKRMSFSETIFLFLLALIIFGPKKLPEIARQVGKYMNEFKRASNEFKAQIEQEIAHLEVESKQHHPAAQPGPGGHDEPHSDCRSGRGERRGVAGHARSGRCSFAEDEPLFATTGSSATPEPVPASGEVAPPASQESHV